MYVPRCIDVVNKPRRQSTSCITPRTVERVVAECAKFITHWSLWRKKIYGLDKQKSVAVATSFKRSQPNFTAFISTCRAIPIMKIGEDRSRIFWNNSARTSSQNRKQFRQLMSSKATKNGVIRQFTYDFLFDIQSNYMSISCRFGDISWQKSVDLVNKNWLSWLSPLRDQKIAIDRHLQPKFYQMCKFRED